MGPAARAVMTLRAPQRDDVELRATALVVLSLGGLAVAALTAFGVRQVLGGEAANVAAVLVTRTLALIALAAGAVVARRRGSPRELSWGAAALLALCGLKLLVQDLPNGNAATLVVGFLALGLSVSLLPRVLRGREPPAPATRRSRRPSRQTDRPLTLRVEAVSVHRQPAAGDA